MPIINFPSNPTEGQNYTFGNFTYVYKENRWVSAQSGATTGVESFKAELADKESTTLIAGVPASEVVNKRDGVPVASVIWFPSREMSANGYIPADGQLLSRTVYASLWKMVEEGKVPKTTSDAEWLSNPKFKGSYSEGDGSTTFRVPDYNGKTTDSMGATFLRGDGTNADDVGIVQGDAIRNITLESPTLVSTAPENRPVNVAGVWMIKVFSAAVNEGVIDAAQLGTQLVGLQSSKLDKDNVVGLMANGAVIESGSNANGTYTKFADGTMDCQCSVTTTSPATGVSSFGVPVVFPAAFASVKYNVVFDLNGNSGSSGVMGVAAIHTDTTSKTANSASVALTALTGTFAPNISRSSLVLVTGRWK